MKSGPANMEYVWLEGLPLALIHRNSATAGTYYVHTDHLHTPQALTDAHGGVVWQADYTPFGQATVTTNAIPFQLRFPGQYFDAETGLHYNWHRYYDPQTGRYLTSDPIGLAGGLNTYAYVDGNPLRWIDPLGLAIGDYPPAPPGYDPTTWGHGKWPNGRDYVTDPDGNNWTVHPEDKGHWPHWDVAKPGEKTRQYPEDSKKPWPGQKNPKSGQSETNPNDPSKPPYCPPSECPAEMVPVLEGAGVVGGAAFGGYIIWKVVKVCLCTWVATPVGGVACAVTP